jgi:aminomethyltransferase
MSLLRTALHAWHAAQGARLVDFAGWDMPVQYSSIVAEHTAVRTACGLFDIAHMGRLRIEGPAAGTWLEGLLTNSVSTLAPGQVRYSLMTNDAGGILDDVLVYRLPDCHLLVVNASNRLKIVDWLQAHHGGADCRVIDQTLSHFMLALQGPRAQSLLQPLTGTKLDELKYYYAIPTQVLGTAALISRTGYTGEDGFEVIVENAAGLALWEQLHARGQEVGLLACGLGCRDTLRLEAGMPLYGHELTAEIDPLTAGLKFAVKLPGRQFPGHAVLAQRAAGPLTRQRVGIRLAGRRIAREGTPLCVGAEAVGVVTSGTFSPTLGQSLAMGYVEPALAVVGTRLEADIRGTREPAEVVSLPFYRRPSA